MTEVENDVLLKKEYAKVKQDNLFERVKNFALAKAETERLAVENLADLREDLYKEVEDNEYNVERYHAAAKEQLEKVGDFVARINFDTDVEDAQRDYERRITEVDRSTKEVTDETT